MIYLAIAVVILVIVTWVQSLRAEQALSTERLHFASEREVWVRERRDLNNRIQVPEAAPFMSEGEEGPSPDDLPILPEFTMDEVELERVKRELAELGYAEGPVG